MSYLRYIPYFFSLLVAGLLALSSATNAQEASTSKTNRHLQSTINFNLPQQNLDTALTSFAEQAGVQLLFQPKDIPDMESRPLYGRYETRKALIALLENTDLKFKTDGEHTVVVFLPSTSTAIRPETREPQKYFARFELPTLLLQEEVIVTGIRSSVIEALRHKKQSSQVEDNIFYQTIGKYPDSNAGDSLQRIPGVSVDRTWGESQEVFIRGIDKTMNQTLINSQYIASSYWFARDEDSLGRAFNFSLVPTEFISSIEVTKSPTADQDEGAIGGTINLHLKKPLQLPKRLLSLTHKQQFSQLPEAWDPKYHLTSSWTNNSSTFGVLFAASHEQRTFRRDAFEVFYTDFGYTVKPENEPPMGDVLIPWGVASTLFDQKREKQSNHLALQWNPNPSWDVLFNHFSTDIDASNSNQSYTAIPGANFIGETPISNYTFELDGQAMLTSAIVDNSESTSGGLLSAFVRESFINTMFSDLSIRHAKNKWAWEIKLGRTHAAGGNHNDTNYTILDTSRVWFNLAKDTVEMDMLDIDVTAPGSNRLISEFSNRKSKLRDDSHFIQFDIEAEVESTWPTKIKAGIKRKKQSVQRIGLIGTVPSETLSDLNLNNIAFDQVSADLSPELNRSTSTTNSIRQFRLLDEEKARNLIADVVRPYWIYNQNGTNYDVTETITSAYALMNTQYSKLSVELGLRATQTIQQSSTEVEPILADLSNTKVRKLGRSYINWLPSLNLRYSFSDKLYLRASASETLSRPGFSYLGLIQDEEFGNLQFPAGNPLLKPTRSTQSDIGIEWYYADESILALNYFYKQLSDLVFTQITRDFNVETGLITTEYHTENGPGPQVSGLEFQWQNMITKNIGVSSNYLYTDVTETYYFENTPNHLKGNSKHQINASLFYENTSLSARLSYNYRSKSYDTVNTTHQEIYDPYGQWDFDINWHYNADFSISLEGVNIFNEVIRTHTDRNLPSQFYELGSYYGLGIQYNYY